MAHRVLSLRSLACAALLLATYRPAGAEAPGTLLELGPVDYSPMKELNVQFAQKLNRDLASRAKDFATFGPQVVFQQVIQEHIADTVPSRGVRYASVDSHGHPRTYSGRVYLPPHLPGTPPLSVPLVVYQHATETRRQFTPYFKKGDETMLGALAADIGGFAVAMPDGDGMGADPSPEMHAYCHASTTATCLLDMVRALRGSVNGATLFDQVNYTWDGRLFIVGYSEGGYIAMAAVRELSTNPAYQDLQLTGAACMAGPFDFSQSTKLLLSDAKTPYARPYIPAYFLAAWESIYPAVVSFKAAVNPALLQAGAAPAGTVSQWLGGILGGDQITPLIQTRLTGRPDRAVPARTILADRWLQENVDNPASQLNQLLKANDLTTAWKPSAPVLLVHDPYDDTVGFNNSQAIFNLWQGSGANPIGIVQLAMSGRGPGHAGGAVLAIPAAFIWIDAGMPRSLLSMTTQAMRDAVIAAAPASVAENLDAAAIALLEEKQPDRALLPLSRIDLRGAPGGGRYVVSFNDWVAVVGKVKFYTIASTPQFPGQTVTKGTGGYTKLVKQMRSKDDTLALAPGQPWFMAVYPQNGLVALTLKFAGGRAGKAGYTLNIKQVKNKIVGRKTPALFNASGNFRPWVNEAAYETPESAKPFITLP